MEILEYENIYNQESSHFFYVLNHKIVFYLIKKYLPGSRRLRILDIGSGGGLLSKLLKKYGKVTALDISKKAVELTKKRGVDVYQGSVLDLNFQSKTFDLVLCIDVLYHVKVRDDNVALKEIYRVVKKGGICLIRVAANKKLKLRHDWYVHTRQRYDKEEMIKKMEKVSFKIEYINYINLSLLLIAFLQQIKEKYSHENNLKSAVRKLPYLLNKFLIKVLYLEFLILRNYNLPSGLGLIVVGRKIRD